jgi:hypothetical protein
MHDITLYSPLLMKYSVLDLMEVLLSNLGAWSKLVFLCGRWVYAGVFSGLMARWRSVPSHIYFRKAMSICAGWSALWWTSITSITSSERFVLRLSTQDTCVATRIALHCIHIAVSYHIYASYFRIVSMNWKMLQNNSHFMRTKTGTAIW